VKAKIVPEIDYNLYLSSSFQITLFSTK